MNYCGEFSLLKVRDWCYSRRRSLFKFAISLISILAALRLGYEFWRLLLDKDMNGAIDLRITHQWVNLWFAGKPLNKIYFLPATYTMLWPLTGWLSFESARWLWAILYVVSVAWLARIVIDETGIKKREEVVFSVLFILSIYSTGITIGNGQVILFLLPAIITAVLLERNREHSPGKDIAVSLLLLFSLLKITITAPFFLISLITQRAFRPLIIAAFGYIILTYVAISYHDSGLIEALRVWVENGSNMATTGGYSHLHIWLGELGLNKLILPSSLGLFFVLGLFLYGFRKTDIWIQLGVAAIVARLWTYHSLYDDLLILIPMIAIFRIRKFRKLSEREGIAADLLLLTSGLGLLCPASFLRLAFPLATLFRAGQAIIWILMLAFLLYYAFKTKRDIPA
jgi:hypothetical protein